MERQISKQDAQEILDIVLEWYEDKHFAGKTAQGIRGLRNIHDWSRPECPAGKLFNAIYKHHVLGAKLKIV